MGSPNTTNPAPAAEPPALTWARKRVKAITLPVCSEQLLALLLADAYLEGGTCTLLELKEARR